MSTGTVSAVEHKMEKATELLCKSFGYQTFRGLQEPAIRRLFEGQNCLVLMPTGSGKSLCYQLPAFVEGDLAIVISPLVALMQDQVQALRQMGFPVTFVNSSLSKVEREERQARIAKGEYKIVYCTPERFRKPEFWAALASRKITLLAVDEAHCISQWGHDFRPEFSRLSEIQDKLGNPVTIALTATATPNVIKEICQVLRITPEAVFDAGLERSNLSLNVHNVYGLDEKIRATIGLLHHSPVGAKIIYCSLISTLYKLSEQLQRFSVPHLLYHGDLHPAEKKKQQTQFMEQENQLILATPAFGLGINKPDVHFMIHFEVPNSIEAYFQEVGRAGRDGQESECHLFYDEDDVSIQMEFLKWANPDAGFISTVCNLIKSGGPKLEAEGLEFLRQQMNFFNSRDYRVETSLNLLDRWGCIEPAKNRLGFMVTEPPSPEVLKLYEGGEKLKRSQSKLWEMVSLAKASSGCRMQEIYKYFGKSGSACGKCDLCRGAKS